MVTFRAPRGRSRLRRAGAARAFSGRENHMKHRRAVMAIAALSLLVGASAAQARVIHIGEYKVSQSRMDQLQRNWVNQIYAHHSLGTWAPMKMNLTDRDLALMGLPPKRVLTAHRYRTPTAFYPGGRMVRLGARAGSKGKPKPGGSTAAAGPSVASFAGTGFFGLRPGAWLLFITPDEIGWCSPAHVYGSPGAYQISTAGHCGKTGDTATVI